MTTLPQPIVVSRETLRAGYVLPYSPEKVRRHEENIRNAERWLAYNVRYQRAMCKTPDPPAWLDQFSPSQIVFMLRPGRRDHNPQQEK